MNKSNEWHVIIGQRERDGQRVGASGHKPEIICLEKSVKRAGAVKFCHFSLWSADVAKQRRACARTTVEGK